MKIFDYTPLPWAYEHPCIVDDEDGILLEMPEVQSENYHIDTDVLEFTETTIGQMVSATPYLIAALLRVHKSLSNIIEYELMHPVRDSETKAQMLQIELVLGLAGVDVDELDYYVDELRKASRREEKRKENDTSA